MTELCAFGDRRDKPHGVPVAQAQAGNHDPEDAAIDYSNSWWRDRAPKVKGAVAGSLHRNGSNPSEFILSVVFDSKEAYEANAADPEQDKWYQGLRALLAADPRWMDGDVLGCTHV